jgi:hypothetical protein
VLFTALPNIVAEMIGNIYHRLGLATIFGSAVNSAQVLGHSGAEWPTRLGSMGAQTCRPSAGHNHHIHVVFGASRTRILCAVCDVRCASPIISASHQPRDHIPYIHVYIYIYIYMYIYVYIKLYIDITKPVYFIHYTLYTHTHMCEFMPVSCPGPRCL